jgi:hypothetical protein
LVKRVAGTLDVRDVGLGFGLIAVVIVVLTLGVIPTALAIGLLALLSVD